MLLTDGAACYPPFARKQNLLHEFVGHNRGEFVKDVKRSRPTIKCHTGTIDAAWTSCKKSFPTLWVPGAKMSCCMPRCGNGDSLTSARSCLTKLHRCCERWSEKEGCNCPIDADNKVTFCCAQKRSKFGRPNFTLFNWQQWLPASLWQNKHFLVKLYFHEHGFRSAGLFMLGHPQLWTSPHVQRHFVCCIHA